MFVKYAMCSLSCESRIIFLPERSSIGQYLPKLSAINIKKQSRPRPLLAHTVLYIFKIQKKYGAFWKPPFQNQPKSVRLQATYGNLHYLRKWFRQCNLSNLSSLNLTHTIAYLLILYLQSTYPKIANLIQILYIVCRALGCFKWVLVKGLRLMSYKLVLHAGPDLTDARPKANPLVRTPHPLLREKRKASTIRENRKIMLWKYGH